MSATAIVTQKSTQNWARTFR